MKLTRLSITVAIGAIVIAVALSLGRQASEPAAAAGPIGTGPATPVVVRYTSAPGNVAPTSRDVTRRTAVFLGLVEVTVLRAYLLGDGPGRQVVVDLVLVSMRPSDIVPSQALRFDLRDANGMVVIGLTVSRPLDQPLHGGDDQRYQLSWNGPATTTADFVVALATGANEAAFSVNLGGALP